MPRFDTIAQVITSTCHDLRMVCMSIAFLFFIFSIYKNYQEFGNFVGIKYLATLFFLFFLLIWFPKISTSLFLGTKAWGVKESKLVIERMDVLMGFQLQEGGYIESTFAAIPWLFFKGSASLGLYVRELFILFLGGSFVVLNTLSPLFIGMLAVPETKSIGINWLMITFSIILSPITIIFGDLLLLWVADYMWACAGVTLIPAAGGAAKVVSMAALAAGGVAGLPVVAIATAALAGAFAMVYLLLIVVAYIGVPWAIMSLFRGGGIGNPLAMTLNTASNIMTMSRAAQSGGQKGNMAAGKIGRALRGMRGGGGGSKLPSASKINLMPKK